MLYIIGGAEEKSSDSPVLARFVTLAGSGPVGIITAASGRPEESFRRYEHALGAALDVLHVNVASRSEADGLWSVRLKRFRGLLITGGDQGRAWDLLGYTALHRAMFRCLRDPEFVLAGTSAGAALMSRVMIAGDGAGMDTVRFSQGLGFWSEVIVDQHFSERNRSRRLQHALAHYPELMGVGVDEDTAFEVACDGSSGRVWGSGAVWIGRNGTPVAQPYRSGDTWTAS